jgi:hypothetical protein
MRVTDHYRITGPVPFVDVHVERDNRLFLDPSAIRNGSDPRSKRAHSLLVNFFTEVLRLRASALAADHVMGQALLNNLHEPNQTRLGMSAAGVTGKAFGPGLADDAWDVLGRNPAARAAVLTRLEHLPIFIEGVGPDLISDLATRIVFEVLVDFTQDMMVAYPSLGAGATTAESNVYDPAAGAWGPSNFTLPYVAPHQLLLIPKEWTYWRLLMEPGPFYNRYATATVQIERSTRDDKGKLHGPSKKSLKVQFKDQRKLNNGQAVKYKQDEDRNLVAEYQQYVDENFEPLADEQIESRTK